VNKRRAEGFLQAMAGDRFEAQSAGTEKSSVHPLAIRAMAERGIDISTHTSQVYDSLMTQRWDYLITVCDDAAFATRSTSGSPSGWQ
jgi:arsenate reductase